MNIELWLSLTIGIILLLVLADLVFTIRATRIYTVRAAKAGTDTYTYRFMISQFYFSQGDSNQTLRRQRVSYSYLILIACAIHYALLLAHSSTQSEPDLFEHLLKATFVAYLFSRQLLSNQVDDYFYKLLEIKTLKWSRLSSGTKSQYIAQVADLPLLVKHYRLLTAALTAILCSLAYAV